MDFSTAGYMGGGVALPTNILVKTNLTAGAGDFTVKIQNAINYVGGLTPDTNGFRGVILLGPGTFQVSNQINLNLSGVVLRGSGSSVGGTTLLMVSNAIPYTFLKISGSGSRVTSNTANLTDAYVPSGATTFNVSSTNGYNVGDTVVINRTVTQAWLQYIGMDTNTLGGVWLSPGKIIYTDRVIKAINGNQITLDAPLTDSFDTNYLGNPCGTMQKYTWAGRPSQVGVEHLRIQAPALPAAYEPLWATAVVDAWVSDIYIQDGKNTCIIDRDCKRVTVDSVVTTHTCGVDGDPANLSCTGSQILFNNCQELGNTSWPFVTGPNGCGPIVVLNLYSEGTEGISPHQRWTTGLLADNCSLPNAPQGAPGIAFWNRGMLGGGQGWCTGWSVAWNCITPYYLLAAAPGTMDWVIGGTGLIVPIPTEPPGTYEKFGSVVTPSSLYLAQLQERLGAPALENIGYPLFTISAPPSISVQRGTNVTFAVTVGDPSGLGNNVGLSVSGLPTGASASWSTNSVIGAGTALLSITASNSLALGSYPLNIIGTNAGLTHTSSVVLAVVNFAISASPVSRAVAGGGTNTTYTITLSTNSSFSGSVNFGLSGLPTSTTASFSPASLSAAGSSTLTMTTTSNTPSGTYALTVSGTNGSAIGVVMLNLTVASRPYWTGAGSDGYWSDAINWNGTPMTPNTDLVFDGGVQVNNTNDLSSGASYSSLTFGPGAGAFVLNGNPISLSGNITNNAGNQQTINLGLNFSTNLTFNGGGGVSDGNIVGGLIIGGGLTNALNSGTATLTLTGVGVLTNRLGGGTNMIAFSDADANWTLVDNVTSTLMTVPWSYTINYGTFNFGTTNSAPKLTLLTVPATTLTSPVIGSSSLGVPATFNMVNGTLTNSALNVGTTANAIGNINMSGGVWSITSPLQNANSVGSFANINVIGGTFSCTDKFYVANRGTGTLSVSGTGYVGCNTLDVAHAFNTGSQGTVNLNGGTLAVNNVITDTGSAGTTNGAETATFNFNGGTLKAQQNNAAFISQSGPGGAGAGSNIVLNLIVQSGGAVIDTTGFNVTNLLALQHDSTLGASPDGGLTKLNTGTLALITTNTYTGGTTVSGGTLALRGSSSMTNSSGIFLAAGATLDVSGRTDGKLTLVSGQTLSGSGTVNGQLQVNTGSTVAPGPGLTVLTVNGNSTLSGTTSIELSQAAGTNDVLKINGTLIYGGTLTLYNLSGTLANGSMFKIFNAASYSGAFTNITPSIINQGFSWDTSSLTVNGILGVVYAPTPLTPTGLAAMLGNTMVGLSWNASSGATSYNIGRSTISGGPYTTVTNLASLAFTDTGLVNGTTYYYVIAAVNGSGSSPNSAQVSVTPMLPPSITVQPSSITNISGTLANFSVTAIGTALTYQWKKNSVALSNGGNVSGATTPTLNLSGVSQSDAADYSVVIANLSGSITSIVATLTVIPAAPTNLVASGSNTLVYLSWAATTGATSYDVKRAFVDGGPYTTITNIGSASFADTGLSNNTTYYYVVAALSSGGSSADSAQASATPTYLPNPWIMIDVGAVGLAGSASENNDTYTVVGSGTGIKGTSDQFCFVYQPMTGDGSITARIVTNSSTLPQEVVGVMIRETTNANSMFTMSAHRGSGGGNMRALRRTSTGGSVASTAGISMTPPNCWVQVTRAGNVFTIMNSTNGISWMTVTNASITMSTNILVGLISTSFTNSVVNTNVYDNVTVVP